jgi:hypothetical protein
MVDLGKKTPIGLNSRGRRCHLAAPHHIALAELSFIRPLLYFAETLTK